MQAGSGRSEAFGILLVILSASLWATVGVATRLVPEAAALSPEALGLARTALAGPLILAFALPGLRRTLPGLRALRAMDRGKLVEFAVSAVIFQVCLFRAFDRLGVTITVFLTVCLPPVIAILWSLLRKSPVGVFGLGALVLALAGLALFFIDDLASGRGSANLQGLGLAVLAALAFVRMSEAARTLGRAASPILVAGLGLTLAGLIFCALSPWLFAAPLGLAARILGDWRMLGLVLYLSIGPTALAYICYCCGIARCRSTVVGLTASMIEPAIAAVLAGALLYEHLTLREGLGCALMALAILALIPGERRRVIPG